MYTHTFSSSLGPWHWPVSSSHCDLVLQNLGSLPRRHPRKLDANLCSVLESTVPVHSATSRSSQVSQVLAQSSFHVTDS